MNFGKALKAALKEKNVSIADLAVKLGINIQQVYRMTRSKDVKLIMLMKVSNALDIDYQELIENAQNHTEERQETDQLS
ncbi:MAG: helix-turn-helix domain-containing protein [bacterium]